MTVAKHGQGKLSTGVYLTVFQGVGPAIVSGGINAGLAYAMYHVEPVVSLWSFTPTSPLAGDYAITIFVQQTLSWILCISLAFLDMRNGLVGALTSRHFYAKALFGIEFKGEDMFRKRPMKEVGRRLFLAIVRGLLFSAVTFIPFWGAAVIITAPIAATNSISSVPGAVVAKGVFAFVLALISCPFMGLLALETAGNEEEEEVPVVAQPV
eukprot:comp21859_c0_seq1/m.31244 comp21859_c0_seq1/g.31244  ORF comp21859_c0_seq1/g.31244 comp21859_c0_seq1/m.31244 type:complete len:210 (-) comp21859_c0_seq1:629-1258(-)